MPLDRRDPKSGKPTYKTGVVSKASPHLRPGRYYCHTVRGSGDAADLPRYLAAAAHRG